MVYYYKAKWYATIIYTIHTNILIGACGYIYNIYLSYNSYIVVVIKQSISSMPDAARFVHNRFY